MTDDQGLPVIFVLIGIYAVAGVLMAVRGDYWPVLAQLVEKRRRSRF